MKKRDAFAKITVDLQNFGRFITRSGFKYIRKDYKWLTQVYISVKPASDDNGRLLWHALGAQTTALIHEYIHVLVLIVIWKK